MTIFIWLYFYRYQWMFFKSLVNYRISSVFFFILTYLLSSLGGGTCYDLVNAYACFCPDRIFRPQCNTTSSNIDSAFVRSNGNNLRI